MFFFDCIKDYCTCSENIYDNGSMNLKHWDLIFSILFTEKLERQIQRVTRSAAKFPVKVRVFLFFFFSMTKTAAGAASTNGGFESFHHERCRMA